MTRSKRWRSCTRKRRFGSRRDATIAARAVERKQGQPRKSNDVYSCVHCGGWHFGHGDNALRARIREALHSEDAT